MFPLYKNLKVEDMFAKNWTCNKNMVIVIKKMMKNELK